MPQIKRIIKIENLENKLSELNSSVENHNKIINERTDKMNYHIDEYLFLYYNYYCYSYYY